MSVSTHVLDAVLGCPAPGLTVRLEGPLGTGEPATERSAQTDADGRVPRFGPAETEAGTYRLTFETGAWFAAQGRETFYPEVAVTFSHPARGHVHVPLLLSPFAYTTYRGS